MLHGHVSRSGMVGCAGTMILQAPKSVVLPPHSYYILPISQKMLSLGLVVTLVLRSDATPFRPGTHRPHTPTDLLFSSPPPPLI